MNPRVTARKSDAPVRERFLGIVGLLSIAGGIICNEWTLAALFSADGIIALPHRIVIWVVDLSSVGLGLALIRYRRVLKKEAMLIMAGLVTIFAAILVGELFIPVLLGSVLSNENRLFLRFSELLFLCAGSMVIICRRSVDLKSILLLGGSIVFCFIAFMIYDFFLAFSLQDRFREFARGDPRYAIHNVHVRDDRFGWKLKSGSRGSHRHPDFDVTYEIDQNGFKKVDNTEHPDFSIWFFGDSFTFGAGVENKDTYANVLKDRYLTKDVNVYNTGVPGYGIVQMFMCFQDVVDKIRRGDVVVLAPISNDIVRHPYQPGTLFLFTVLGDIPIETFPYFENGVIKYDKRRSKLWTKLKAAQFMAPYTGTFWSSTYGRSLLSRSVRDSRAMMEIIKERTEMKGARFVLLFLPTMAECKERNYEVDVSRFAYYDVLKFFPSKEEELNTLFFPTDRHYNPAGHALAAKAIVQTLLENKIIDKKYLKVSLQQ